MSQASQVRTYDPAASVVFLKTNERFGGLSNMAPGFPLRLNGVRIRTSEALYQACRFPHMPDVQGRIIDERSPMTAKMRSKPFRKDSRPDWDAVRVKIMRWCLRVKLAQHWKEFGRLLLATGERPIVEQSRKDDFWGAKVAEDGSLIGMNVLGRLLMELREQLKGDDAESLRAVEPLSITKFLLFQKPIKTVCADEASIRPVGIEIRPVPPAASPPSSAVPQPSLFDQPMIARGQMDIQNNRATEANSNKNPKPYPGYRDSSLPWLGDVPVHWEVRRLRTIAEMRVSNVDKHTQGDEIPVRLCNYVDVYKNDRIRQGMAFMKATACQAEIERFRLEQDDVLITKDSEAWNDIGIPALVAETADDLICGYHLALLRPLREMLGPYLARTLQTTGAAYQFHVRANGVTRYGLTHSGIQSVCIPLPPLPEQRAIVRYLDHADRRIRRYVRAKRRLVALLEEERQVVINWAVTRGLGPNVRLKPSGVEWLGDVPKHWEVRRLRTVSEMRVSNVDKHTKEDEVPVRLCNYVDVYRNKCITPTMPFMTATASLTEIERFRLVQNDVLITKDSEAFDDIGVPALVTESADDLLSGYHLAILRPFKETLGTFLARTIESKAVAYQFHVRANGVTRYGLTHNGIQSVQIPLPPLAEQTAIVEYLDKATASIDAAIVRARRQIELVEEYRARLIADVVTGKLDVREAAAQLPDEADDEEPVDEGVQLADNMNQDPYEAGESAEEPATESEVTA